VRGFSKPLLRAAPAAISAALGDYQNAAAIAAIIVMNAALGVRQEYRTELAIAALKKLAVPSVKTRRNGKVQAISATELVPGDIVLLEAGNVISADGRLLASSSLRVQEAALTGESAPVEKDARAVLNPNHPLAERRNIVYKGTTITYGRGEAVVTETGMSTELGRIASMMQQVERTPTPLQRRLDQLGRVLITVAIVIVGIVFLSGLIRGEEVRLMFLTAVSLAVAAVPEGLPAAVTIALALGAQRMLKRNALVRRLAAVETLGSVTAICSDKTGTLTQNEMTVSGLYVPDRWLDLTPAAGSALDPASALLLSGGALCNDAVFEPAGHSDHGRALGDPMEVALLSAATRAGLDVSELTRAFPRISELPFESERKRMTTVHDWPRDVSRLAQGLLQLPYDAPISVAFTKGAVDTILDICTQVWTGGRFEPLEGTWRARIQAAHDRMADQGIRVLALAFRVWDQPPEPNVVDVEQDLAFVGLFGMIDPARPEAQEAIATCEQAGIRPLMITGDHALTARHIAEQLGLNIGARVITGRELDEISVPELERQSDETAVFARVSPEHKVKIVEALQNRGHSVAMTGDGVNDAPALKKADIGIAMGLTGTDVAREAADMVLQDDNFATIVAAVREGRIIFDNIRKFITYLLASNSGELWVMLLGPVLGMSLPLLPIQILWMNLITDGLPALALGVEPAERNVMRRPPYPPAERILGRGVLVDVAWIGLWMAAISLALGYGYSAQGRAEWQTMLFTTLTFSQIFLALGLRSRRDSLFQIGLLSNKPLLGAVTISVVLQVLIIYTPLFRSVFDTVVLGATDLFLSAGVGLLVFLGVEVEKVLRRTQDHPTAR